MISAFRVRAARRDKCVLEMEEFFKRAGEIIGQARRTSRGQPEGWIISPEEREELRSIQERVYQFVYFGIIP